MTSDKQIVEIEDLVRKLRGQAPKPAPVRKRLLKAAQNLVLVLEQPEDVIERVCFQASGIQDPLHIIQS